MKTDSGSDERPSRVHDSPWVRVMRPGPVKDESVSGKWLLYVAEEDVDEVWARLKEATETRRLGCAAKAATASNQTERGKHVICIYTLDWRDQSDVRRVLAELRSMGFTGRLSYKRDADTLAGVYGAGSATYVSQPGSLEIVLKT